MHDLEAQLLDAPDDAALRLVLADALEQRGDPRGRLIQLHHALAAATVREDRIRLRGAIRELLASELPELAGLDLEWDLGFVRAATITGEVAARLLAHPAARLLRELTLAVLDEDEVAAAVKAIEARPRPSLLARLSVGHVGYLAHTTAGIVTAFAKALARDPELVVGRRERMSQAELEAEHDGDTSEERNELWILQIAPVTENWHYWVDLVIRDGCHEAVEEIHEGLSERVQRLLALNDGSPTGEVFIVRFDQTSDRTYAGYANLYRALKALAPYIEDVRFTITECYSTWVDEYAIRDGELIASRGHTTEDSRVAIRAYWRAEVARRPDDHDVRRFAARMFLDDAGYALGRIDHQSGAERRDTAARARAALDHAGELDERNPALWHQRGQLARALGDLPESERCFARQAELDDRPAIAFDRALLAVAAGDDDRGAALVATLSASHPELSGPQLLAGYLGRDPARLRALLAIVDERRRAITPLREHQSVLIWLGLEPAQEELIRTGRHPAIMAWLLEQLPELAARDAALRAPAAACLLGWAEVFRIRVAHNRGKQEATQLARKLYRAAAALDPLGGSVHYYWSIFVGSRDGHDREVKKLEEGLALAPDHLGILGKLGKLARKARDHDRAIALLERYVALFLGYRQPTDVWGIYWDSHLAELSIAHYEKACFALHGVAPGEHRPPGRPSNAALDAADAALVPALAMYERLSSSQKRAGAGVFQCKSMIEEYRRNFDDALAWADRALEADGTSAHLWSTRGGCLNNLGRLDEAITHCERALEIDAKHWHAHLVIACVLVKRGGARDDIYARLRRVIELWPESRAELAIEPDLAALRDEPAFAKLIKKPRSRRR